MNDYKIEHDIPMPRGSRGSRHGITNTLRQLNIGDSVLIDTSETPSIRNNIYHLAKYAGITVASRSESATSIRVWRVEDKK